MGYTKTARKLNEIKAENTNLKGQLAYKDEVIEDTRQAYHRASARASEAGVRAHQAECDANMAKQQARRATEDAAKVILKAITTPPPPTEAELADANTEAGAVIYSTAVKERREAERAYKAAAKKFEDATSWEAEALRRLQADSE